MCPQIFPKATILSLAVDEVSSASLSHPWALQYCSSCLAISTNLSLNDPKVDSMTTSSTLSNCVKVVTLVPIESIISISDTGTVVFLRTVKLPISVVHPLSLILCVSSLTTNPATPA